MLIKQKSNVEINIQSKLMAGIFIIPLCDDCQLRPSAPLFAVCTTDHTLSKPLEWTNIERSLWQHAIT